MNILTFLILFPLVIAAILLVVKNDKARTGIVVTAAIIIAATSIFSATQFLGCDAIFFKDEYGTAELVGYVALAVDVLLSVYIIGKGIKYKKILPVVLAAIQMILVVGFELTIASGIEVENYLYVDTLSIIMVLIIGVIGGGICIYALGYMRDFQAHDPQAKDSRPKFFALMFVFLSAMYLLVFSNDMLWLFTAWEITTVCSFVLIGYTKTEEAIDNSFLQITLNLIGGLAFAIALVLCAMTAGTLEFDKFIEFSIGNSLMMLPIALLALAGLTKAAQMPFHRWLLGAMVAPTPTSALLHSSTMVKAGVFLLIKLAPCFGFNAPGIMVMLIGGATFMLCSFLAISQRNAKRVLAYSTIANLGLIAACAGTGTAEGVWAAIFLMIFHAAAKSLLFMCVGTAEHHIGSRDIEDMDLLFERMPRLARYMMFGIMVMFIAPFGMLISKWAALQSFVDSGNLILVMFLAFGSAATFFFWAKWLGKLSAVAGNQEDIEGTVNASEWGSIGLTAVLAALCCAAFPLISSSLVVPYLSSMFGANVSAALASTNLIIVAIMSIFIIVMLLGLPKESKKKKVGIYLSGSSVDNAGRTFKNSFSQPQKATQSNWYLEGIFGEDRLEKYAIWGGIVLIVLGILVSVFTVFSIGGVL